MTRGQVASVSIGSGFRNAPGMPEPNISNSVPRRLIKIKGRPSVLQPLEVSSANRWLSMLG